MVAIGPGMKGKGCKGRSAAPTYELGASLDQTKHNTEESAEGCKKTRFLECPMLEKTVQQCDRVRKIMEEVMVHYGATFSVLTWRANGELHLKASHLSEVVTVPQSPGHTCYQLFNHIIDRDLPIIVYDVRGHETYGRISLPDFVRNIRFYVGCPLITHASTYIGTLCVVDCSRPRAEFSLRDVRILEEKARELVTAAEEHNSSAPSSGDPGVGLISKMSGADMSSLPTDAIVQSSGSSSDDKFVS